MDLPIIRFFFVGYLLCRTSVLEPGNPFAKCRYGKVHDCTSAAECTYHAAAHKTDGNENWCMSGYHAACTGRCHSQEGCNGKRQPCRRDGRNIECWLLWPSDDYKELGYIPWKEQYGSFFCTLNLHTMTGPFIRPFCWLVRKMLLRNIIPCLELP